MKDLAVRVSNESLRIAHYASRPPPDGAFLDFDPILPGWPESQQSDARGGIPSQGWSATAPQNARGREHDANHN